MDILRCQIQQKKLGDNYSWSPNPAIREGIVANMILTTYKTSLSYAGKPNSIGEDNNHRDILYKMFALSYLQNRR